MALSEFELRRCERSVAAFVERRRPPPHLRTKVDLSFRIADQSVEIFEIRPHWQDQGKMIESSIAKATYVKSRRSWHIFWKRSDFKWHRYQPDPEVPTIEDFLAVVQIDEHSCFFG